MQFRDLMSRLDSISEDTVATMPVHMDQASLDKLKSSNPALFQQILKTNPEMAMALQSPSIGQNTTTPTTPTTPNAVTPQGATPATPGQQTTSGNTSSQVPAKQPTGTIGSDEATPMQGKRPQESYDAFKKSMSNVVEELTTEAEAATIPRWKRALQSVTTSDAEKQAAKDAEIREKIQGWIDLTAKDPKRFKDVPKELRRQVQQALPAGPAKDLALIQLHIEKTQRDLSTATDPNVRARLEAQKKELLAREKNVLTPPEKTETDPKVTSTDPKVTSTDPKVTSTDPKVTSTDAGDGPTGTALAKLGISRDQRRNQEFVDKTLGAGKFKAGSAESNLALLAAAKKGETSTSTSSNVAAPVTAAGNNNAGISSALVQNRPELAKGTVASETDKDGTVYGVDANGQRTHKLDTSQQRWVKLDATSPAVSPELQGSQTSTSQAAQAPAVDDEAAAIQRVEQGKRDQEIARRAGIVAKYKDLDPTKVQVRTGNYGKPYYELKTGDVDYDKDGRKIVYTRNGRGPGEWSAGSWADHTANPFSSTTPGNVIGPSYDSDEGKKFVSGYRDRTIGADDHAVMKDYWAKNPPKAVTAPAPEVRQLQAQTGSNGFDGVTVPKRLAGGQVQAVDLGLTDADRAKPVPRKSDGSIDLGVTGADMKNAPRNPDGSVKLESIVRLDSVVEELMEWSMGDRIHPDVPYTGWDAATDAGIAGLGALATYATGGLAAPVAGAATVARGGRLANMLYKGYQGTKNVAKGIQAVATNPEARALANQATSKVKLAKGAGTALAGDAATSIGLSTAADKLDQVATDLEKPKAENESYKIELDRIKHLAKR